MWKLIIKNLWNRRRNNGWLLCELILVSIVTWIIVDPVVVLMHDKALPLGYDADRLCTVELGFLAEQAPQFDKQATEPAAMIEDCNRLMQKVREYPEVKKATPLMTFAYINSQGNSTGVYQYDTLNVNLHFMYYSSNQEFFETYGIKAAPGSPSAEALSKRVMDPNDIIVTQNLVDRFFKDGRGVGKRLYSSYEKDTTYYRIVGVVENIKVYSSWRPSPIVFTAMPEPKPSGIADGRILVRLKEGVSMDQFIHNFRPWAVKNLNSGNLFVRSVKSYNDLIVDREASAGLTNKIRLNVALAIFFMVSLCLGVIGTFWLQTRKRREEIGILLSFGGHPSYIVRMLLGEGWVLTTLSFLLGCLIYVQYALKEGLYAGACWMKPDEGYWVSTFGSHFIGVSLVAYLLILIVVSIGIYIPARKISKINPVEALRDE